MSECRWRPVKGERVEYRGRPMVVMDDLCAGRVPVRPVNGGVETFVRPQDLTRAEDEVDGS
ncbi:hypothetical protein [Kitasatospora sp. NPDC050543]|uniref:hypothetical protein n=1 Tax=Kitasatospora sp. NPDC050543 TaxID=3364054 RepID=UPI0037BCF795